MDKIKEEKYTFDVIWSEEDEEFIGICHQFPSLSHLDTTEENALAGIKELVEIVTSEK
jgi:hypothetical protein